MTSLQQILTLLCAAVPCCGESFSDYYNAAVVDNEFDLERFAELLGGFGFVNAEITDTEFTIQQPLKNMHIVTIDVNFDTAEDARAGVNAIAFLQYFAFCYYGRLSTI